MKNLKRILALVLAVVICVFACSCTMYQRAIVSEDGSVTYYIKMSIEKSKAESVRQKLSNPDNPFTGDVEDDEYYLAILESYLKQAKVEVIDDVEYYVIEETDDGYNVEDLLYEYALDYENGAGEFTTTEMWAYTPEAYYQEPSDEDYEEDYDVAFEALGVELNYISHITFPYKITNTNCEQVDEYTIVEPQEEVILYYAVTEKSEADWAKAQDIEAELTKKALEQLKPLTPEYVNVGYETANELFISWDEFCYNENFDDYVDVGNASEVQVKVNGGKWKTIATVDYYDIGYYNYKIKHGNTYEFRVRNLRTSPSGNFETLYSEYKTSKKIVVPYLNQCPYAKLTSTAKKSFTLSFTKPHKIKCTGYEIKYSTDKNFKKGVKKVQVARQILPVTVRELKSGKTYYVKIRKYQKAGAGYSYNVYGKWSKALKIKVK